jgi:hypothetical protein
MDMEITPEMVTRLRRTGSIATLWLNVAVIAAVLFLICEIAPAFFAGSTMQRMFGGR